MSEPTQRLKQQYQRFIEIFEHGKQRYIEAVGHPKRYYAGVKKSDYLTDQEREEAKVLLRQMFKKNESANSVSNNQEKTEVGS